MGIAKVDLKEMLKAGEDIVERPIDVFSTEAQSKVSRFLNTGNKPIGSLTITLKASHVFRATKLLESKSSPAASDSEK